MLSSPLREQSTDGRKDKARIFLMAIMKTKSRNAINRLTPGGHGTGKTKITGVKQTRERGKPTGIAKVRQRHKRQIRSGISRSLNKGGEIHRGRGGSTTKATGGRSHKTWRSAS
jgi:hypothetical protein